jgi:hypothetical protein
MRGGLAKVSDAESQSAWVGRVLGVTVLTQDAAPAAASAARLQEAGLALRHLRDAAAPELAALTARYAALVAAAKTDPSSLRGPLAELEEAIALATSAARAREAMPTRGRGVAFRTMLLEWRAAQQRVAAGIKAVGDAILAHPEVQADPRFAEVKQAVALLPGLVPRLDDALDAALDAGLKATDPAEAQRVAAQAIAAVDASRRALAAATRFQALDGFAGEVLGGKIDLHADLDATLAGLRAQLAA